MSYGPQPWQQRHWDARAATNFMAGGAGGGLIVAGVLAGPELAPLLLGAACVAIGLLAVWLEIGRPLRALNVFRHPQASWMTREGTVALVLFAAVGAAVLWPSWPSWRWLAGMAALAFVYCQGRILRAARGIPAWREPLIVPLMVSTALAEGAALCWLVRLGVAAPAQPAVLLGLLAAALVARFLMWHAWRGRVRAAPKAMQAIDDAGRLFKGGTLAALALCVVAWLAPPAPWLVWAVPAAAALALAGGLWFKFTLVQRAAFNQGFALPHLPVRGVSHVRAAERR